MMKRWMYLWAIYVIVHASGNDVAVQYEGMDLPTITALIQKTYGVAFDVVDQATYEAFVEEQSVDL